jgi:hypothetical protein
MLAFIHMDKSGGTTVRYILRSAYGSRHAEVEPWHTYPNEYPPFSTADLRRLRKIYPRLASIAGHRVTGYADLQEPGTEFRYFTLLRDPLKLCASRFQFDVDYRRKKHLVFDEWLQRAWLQNVQTKQIAGTPSVDDAIRVIQERGVFVGLTDRFDESLVLLQALRAPDLDIRYSRVNVARDGSLAAELLSNQATRDALTEANHADVALYEYVRNELYPGFQQEYGPSLEQAVAEFRAGLGEVRGKRRGRSAFRSYKWPRNFNRRKLFTSRLKQFGVYRPLLRLYRGERTSRLAERLLD